MVSVMVTGSGGGKRDISGGISDGDCSGGHDINDSVNDDWEWL